MLEQASSASAMAAAERCVCGVSAAYGGEQKIGLKLLNLLWLTESIVDVSYYIIHLDYL